MKIRADSVLVSTLLFTIALLWLIPKLWVNCTGADGRILLANLDDAGFCGFRVTLSDVSIASLAIILIGLIVLWTGYVSRSRPAWLVMCVIAWAWTYPLFISPMVVPVIQGKSAFSLPELLYSAMLGWRTPRTVVTLALVFSLMLIALVLPLRRIFGNRQVERPVYRPTARAVVFSLIGALALLFALRAWLSVGILYEIPFQRLDVWLVAPPPPPPPGAENAP